MKIIRIMQSFHINYCAVWIILWYNKWQCINYTARLCAQYFYTYFLDCAKENRIYSILTKSMYDISIQHHCPLQCTVILSHPKYINSLTLYTRNIEKLYPRNGEQCSWSEWDDILWKFLIHLQIFIDFGPDLYTVPHTMLYSVINSFLLINKPQTFLQALM